MDDFIILSILDLQLDTAKYPKPVDKRQVIAYIMLGETCIDSIVLGSPNASIQDQKALAVAQQVDSGGAASPDQLLLQEAQEERGSSHLEQELPDGVPEKIMHLNHLQKRTKIPLSGLTYGPNNKSSPKSFQIIVRRIGTENERFGSISFKLKRFQQKPGKSFQHWVTLYDSLDDDEFEGTEGVDDMFDYPRVFLEYQIVSSQFTSMINQLDKLGAGVDQARDKQDRLRDERSKASSRKTGRASRLTTVSQTVEFTETRAAKVSGMRPPFEGRVLTGSQQESYFENRAFDVQSQGASTDRQEQDKRRKTLMQLTKLIEEYQIDNLKDELINDIQETQEDAKYATQSQNRQIDEVLSLVSDMTAQHQGSLDQPVGDIVEGCFRDYAEHLDALEKADIGALKKKLGELKGMSNSLARDMTEADRNKVYMLRERERLVNMANYSEEKRSGDKLRMRTEQTLAQLNYSRKEVSEDLKEMLDGLAEEAKQGNDGLAYENRNQVLALFDSSSEALDKQLDTQGERAMIDQRLRHHKLLNLGMDEEIDGQIDKKIRLQQGAQRTRKQIARIIRKTQTYLVDSERLLTDKLIAVKAMATEVSRLEKERMIISNKKYDAQNAYIDANQQRNDLRLRWEREQKSRAHLAQQNEHFREAQRERTILLSEKVMKMSTDPGNRDKSPYGETSIKNLLGELEAKQRVLMLRHQQMDSIMEKRANKMTSGGIKSNIKMASDQLNSFVIESRDQKLQMQVDLQQTKDKLQDLDKKKHLQESRLREFRQTKAAAERRLQVISESNEDMGRRDKANRTTDFVKKTSDLTKLNQEKQFELEKMLKKTATGSRDENVIDQAVKLALQRSRRNSNMLQKLTSGVYKVKNKAQVVTVELRGQTNEYTVQYTDQRDRVQEASLTAFVATL